MLMLSGEVRCNAGGTDRLESKVRRRLTCYLPFMLDACGMPASRCGSIADRCTLAVTVPIANFSLNRLFRLNRLND